MEETGGGSKDSLEECVGGGGGTTSDGGDIAGEETINKEETTAIADIVEGAAALSPGQESVDILEKGALSPLTGSYLLIVLAEPHSEEDREIIIKRLTKGLRSWDLDSTHVDLSCELLNLANAAPEGDEARNGEKLVQWASENLVVEVLIHCQVNTLLQCMKNLLSSFTKHRHIIHAGYTFQGSGSWILQDGTFSFTDFVELWEEPEVHRILGAYKGDISLSVHCAEEDGWTDDRLRRESFTKLCQVHMNPPEKLTGHSSGIISFVEYISKMASPAPLKEILEPSEIVGNIRFSHPTLYVFPGGQGDAALFGVNGFNMLIDGGFSRRSCFWDFTRHLDRLDAVLLTRVNNNSVAGLDSVLDRKKMNQVYPQIGHFFGNVMERKHPEMEKESSTSGELLVSLTETGQRMLDNLRNINLRPQHCFRDHTIEPINLYHKVGHGKLDMYVLNPAKDSREVREFLSKWNTDCKSFVQARMSVKVEGKEMNYPVLNLVSICALLVWQPDNPREAITRILFPGSTPQQKIFEALGKLKHLEFLKYPVCSAKTIAASHKSRSKSERVVSEARHQLSSTTKDSADGGTSSTGLGRTSSSHRAPSESRVSSKYSYSGVRSKISSSQRSDSSSTIQTSTGELTASEKAEKERKSRERSRDKRKVASSTLTSSSARSTDREIKDKDNKTLESESAAGGGVKRSERVSRRVDSGLSKTSSAARVSSSAETSRSTSRVASKVSSKIDTGKKPPQLPCGVTSPPAREKKEKEAESTPTSKKSTTTTGSSKYGIGVTRTVVSKASASASAVGSSPPVTPPKSAKDATNRKVIEHKTTTARKSLIDTAKSKEKVETKATKPPVSKSSSSTTTTTTSAKSTIPRPSTASAKKSSSASGANGNGNGNGPVAVKRPGISASTKAAAAVGAVGLGVAGAALTSALLSSGGESEDKDKTTPAEVHIGTNGNGVHEDSVEKEIQDASKTPEESEGGGGGEGEMDLNGLGLSVPVTESSSELSSLDHISVTDDNEIEESRNGHTISEDIITMVSKERLEDVMGVHDIHSSETHTITEPGGEGYDEEDEYLIIEKDESAGGEDIIIDSNLISDEQSKKFAQEEEDEDDHSPEKEVVEEKEVIESDDKEQQQQQQDDEQNVDGEKVAVETADELQAKSPEILEEDIPEPEKSRDKEEVPDFGIGEESAGQGAVEEENVVAERKFVGLESQQVEEKLTDRLSVEREEIQPPSEDENQDDGDEAQIAESVMGDGTDEEREEEATTTEVKPTRSKRSIQTYEESIEAEQKEKSVQDTEDISKPEESQAIATTTDEVDEADSAGSKLEITNDESGDGQKSPAPSPTEKSFPEVDKSDLATELAAELDIVNSASNVKEEESSGESNIPKKEEEQEEISQPEEKQSENEEMEKSKSPLELKSPSAQEEEENKVDLQKEEQIIPESLEVETSELAQTLQSPTKETISEKIEIKSRKESVDESKDEQKDITEDLITKESISSPSDVNQKEIASKTEAEEEIETGQGQESKLDATAIEFQEKVKEKVPSPSSQKTVEEKTEWVEKEICEGISEPVPHSVENEIESSAPIKEDYDATADVDEGVDVEGTSLPAEEIEEKTVESVAKKDLGSEKVEKRSESADVDDEHKPTEETEDKHLTDDEEKDAKETHKDEVDNQTSISTKLEAQSEEIVKVSTIDEKQSPGAHVVDKENKEETEIESQNQPKEVESKKVSDPPEAVPEEEDEPADDKQGVSDETEIDQSDSNNTTEAKSKSPVPDETTIDSKKEPELNKAEAQSVSPVPDVVEKGDDKTTVVGESPVSKSPIPEAALSETHEEIISKDTEEKPVLSPLAEAIEAIVQETEAIVSESIIPKEPQDKYSIKDSTNATVKEQSVENEDLITEEKDNKSHSPVHEEIVEKEVIQEKKHSLTSKTPEIQETEIIEKSKSTDEISTSKSNEKLNTETHDEKDTESSRLQTPSPKPEEVAAEPELQRLQTPSPKPEEIADTRNTPSPKPTETEAKVDTDNRLQTPSPKPEEAEVKADTRKTPSPKPEEDSKVDSSSRLQTPSPKPPGDDDDIKSDNETRLQSPSPKPEEEINVDADSKSKSPEPKNEVDAEESSKPQEVEEEEEIKITTEARLGSTPSPKPEEAEVKSPSPKLEEKDSKVDTDTTRLQTPSPKPEEVKSDTEEARLQTPSPKPEEDAKSDNETGQRTPSPKPAAEVKSDTEESSEIKVEAARLQTLSPKQEEDIQSDTEIKSSKPEEEEVKVKSENQSSKPGDESKVVEKIVESGKNLDTALSPKPQEEEEKELTTDFITKSISPTDIKETKTTNKIEEAETTQSEMSHETTSASPGGENIQIDIDPSETEIFKSSTQVEEEEVSTFAQDIKESSSSPPSGKLIETGKDETETKTTTKTEEDEEKPQQKSSSPSEEIFKISDSSSPSKQEGGGGSESLTTTTTVTSTILKESPEIATKEKEETKEILEKDLPVADDKVTENAQEEIPDENEESPIEIKSKDEKSLLAEPIESQEKPTSGSTEIETEKEVPEEKEEKESDIIEKDIITTTTSTSAEKEVKGQTGPSDTTTTTEDKEKSYSQRSELEEPQSDYSGKEFSPDSVRTDELDQALEDHRRRLSAANLSGAIDIGNMDDKADIDTSRESQFGSMIEDDQPTDDLKIGDDFAMDKEAIEAEEEAQTPVQLQDKQDILSGDILKAEEKEESDVKVTSASAIKINETEIKKKIQDQEDSPSQTKKAESGEATPVLLTTTGDKKPSCEEEILSGFVTEEKSPSDKDKESKLEVTGVDINEIEEVKAKENVQESAQVIIQKTTEQAETPVKPTEEKDTTVTTGGGGGGFGQFGGDGSASSRPFPIPSAIPSKIPRESREVIRTPDEVADLPVHEEVEPGTYETDEFVHDDQGREEEGDEEESFEKLDEGEGDVQDAHTPEKLSRPENEQDTTAGQSLEKTREEFTSTTGNTTTTAPGTTTLTTFTSSITHTTKDEESPIPEVELEESSHDQQEEDKDDDKNEKDYKVEKPEVIDEEEKAEVIKTEENVIMEKSLLSESGFPANIVEKIDAAVSPVLESLLTKSVEKSLEKTSTPSEEKQGESGAQEDKSVKEEDATSNIKGESVEPSSLEIKDEQDQQPGESKQIGDLAEIEEIQSTTTTKTEATLPGSVESDKYSTIQKQSTQPDEQETVKGAEILEEEKGAEEQEDAEILVGEGESGPNKEKEDVRSKSPLDLEDKSLETKQDAPATDLLLSPSQQIEQKLEEIDEKNKEEMELETTKEESISFLQKGAAIIASVVITPSTPPVTAQSDDSQSRFPVLSAPSSPSPTSKDIEVAKIIDVLVTPDKKVTPVAVDESPSSPTVIIKDSTEQTIAADKPKPIDELSESQQQSQTTGSSKQGGERKVSVSDESSSSSALTAIVKGGIEDTSPKEIITPLKEDDDNNVLASNEDKVITTTITTTTTTKTTTSSEPGEEIVVVEEKREKLFYLPRDEEDEDDDDESGDGDERESGTKATQEEEDTYELDNGLGAVEAGLLNAANTLSAPVVHQSPESIATIPSPRSSPERSQEGSARGSVVPQEEIEQPAKESKSPEPKPIVPVKDTSDDKKSEENTQVVEEKASSPSDIKDLQLSSQVHVDKDTFDEKCDDKPTTPSQANENEPSEIDLKVKVVAEAEEQLTAPATKSDGDSSEKISSTTVDSKSSMDQSQTETQAAKDSAKESSHEEKEDAKSPTRQVDLGESESAVTTTTTTTSTTVRKIISQDLDEPISEGLIESANSAVAEVCEAASETVEVAQNTLEEVEKSAEELLHTIQSDSKSKSDKHGFDGDDDPPQVIEEIIVKEVAKSKEESEPGEFGPKTRAAASVEEVADKICDSMQKICHEGPCEHDDEDDGREEVVEELCIKAVAPPPVIPQEFYDGSSDDNQSQQQQKSSTITTTTVVTTTTKSDGSTEEVTTTTETFGSDRDVLGDIEEQIMTYSTAKSPQHPEETTIEEVDSNLETISETQENISSVAEVKGSAASPSSEIVKSPAEQIKSPIIDLEEQQVTESKSQEGQSKVAQMIETEEAQVQPKKHKELSDYIDTIREAKAVFDTLLQIAKSGAALSSAVEECKENAQEAIRRHLEAAEEVYRPAKRDDIVDVPDSPEFEEGITVYETLEQMARAGSDLFGGLVEKVEQEIEDKSKREAECIPETSEEAARRYSAELAVNAALSHLHETFKTMQTMGSPRRSSFHAASKRQGRHHHHHHHHQQAETEVEEESAASGGSSSAIFSQSSTSLQLSTSVSMAESTLKSPDDEFERSEGETMRESIASFTSGVVSETDDRPDSLFTFDKKGQITQLSSQQSSHSPSGSEMGDSNIDSKAVKETTATTEDETAKETQKPTSTEEMIQSEMTTETHEEADSSKSKSYETLTSAEEIHTKSEGEMQGESNTGKGNGENTQFSSLSFEQSQSFGENSFTKKVSSTTSSSSTAEESIKSALESRILKEHFIAEEEILSAKNIETSFSKVTKDAVSHASEKSYEALATSSSSSLEKLEKVVEQASSKSSESAIESSFAKMSKESTVLLSDSQKQQQLISETSDKIYEELRREKESSISASHSDARLSSTDSLEEQLRSERRETMYYDQKSSSTLAESGGGGGSNNGEEPNSLKTVTTTTTSVLPGGAVTKTTISRRFSSSADPEVEESQPVVSTKLTRRASEAHAQASSIPEQITSSAYGLTRSSTITSEHPESVEVVDEYETNKKEHHSGEFDARPSSSDFGYQTRESGDEESGNYPSLHGYSTMLVGSQERPGSGSGSQSGGEIEETTTTTTTTTVRRIVQQTVEDPKSSDVSKTMVITTSSSDDQNQPQSQQQQQHFPAFPQDILEEETYSSGDFSDSQVSTVPTQHAETDDEVHNFDQQASAPVVTKGDVDNGNYSSTTTNVVTQDDGSVTTETVTSVTSTDNGNIITRTTRVERTSRTIVDDLSGSENQAQGEESSTSTTTGGDIVKEWGKPLGLPVVYTEGAEGGANNGPESGSFGGKTTPKKTSSSAKPPGTPAKSASGSSKDKDKKSSSSSRRSKHSPIYVDLAYVPHHGNSHYCDSEFFRMIRARYYVFSGLEPSREVFEGLLEGKQQWEDKNIETTVIPTYDTDTLGYWVADSEKELAEAKIDLAPSASRCTINLQDHETSCAAYRLEF